MKVSTNVYLLMCRSQIYPCCKPSMDFVNNLQVFGDQTVPPLGGRCHWYHYIILICQYITLYIRNRMDNSGATKFNVLDSISDHIALVEQELVWWYLIPPIMSHWAGVPCDWSCYKVYITS